MAVTRFSGKPAPERPDADLINREAFRTRSSDHGSGAIKIWKRPFILTNSGARGFGPTVVGQGKDSPPPNFSVPEMKEFFSAVDDVRKSASPNSRSMFSAKPRYEAGADLANWIALAAGRQGETWNIVVNEDDKVKGNKIPDQPNHRPSQVNPVAPLLRNGTTIIEPLS